VLYYIIKNFYWGEAGFCVEVHAGVSATLFNAMTLVFSSPASARSDFNEVLATAASREWGLTYTAADVRSLDVDVIKTFAQEPRTPSGQIIYTPSGYSYVPEHTAFVGFRYTVPKGAHAIFDEQLTTQVKVQGGDWWVTGAVDGDYIEFAVVDKDNVLGLFDTYGLTPGSDVLELGKFMRTIYLPPGSSEGSRRVASPQAVYSGLYLRVIYHSVGALVDPVIAPSYMWHEV
jgi:hypothetical protein